MTTFTEQARDILAERLRDGKKVNGLTLGDLIDADLSGPRCRFATNEVVEILLADYPDSALYRSRYLDTRIAEWVGKQEDLVREVASEIAEEYAQDQAA